MQEYGIIHNAGGTVAGKEIVITNLPRDRFFGDKNRPSYNIMACFHQFAEIG